MKRTPLLLAHSISLPTPIMAAAATHSLFLSVSLSLCAMLCNESRIYVGHFLYPPPHPMRRIPKRKWMSLDWKENRQKGEIELAVGFDSGSPEASSVGPSELELAGWVVELKVLF